MSGPWSHICVDMQRMFAEDTPWHVAWMSNTVPAISEVVHRHPEKTIFTRFMPPLRASQAAGMWKAYYEKWWMMTREHLSGELVDLLPQFRALVPPARVFDKSTYSPWLSGLLHQRLSNDGIETIVLTGGETDVCVLATALGAIDRGYRVILLKDAVCSGLDDTHDASLELLNERFSAQVSVLTTEAFLRGGVELAA